MCISTEVISVTKFSIEETIKGLSAVMKESKSTTKKAKYYLSLKQLKDQIEKEMEEYKVGLLEEKVEQYFLDDDMKVIYQEGAKNSAIDQKGLYNELKEKRLNDFLEVCSVSATSLKKLTDGEALIALYKYDLGTTKEASIKVAALTDKDRKRLLENK